MGSPDKTARRVRSHQAFPFSARMTRRVSIECDARGEILFTAKFYSNRVRRQRREPSSLSHLGFMDSLGGTSSLPASGILLTVALAFAAYLWLSLDWTPARSYEVDLPEACRADWLKKAETLPSPSIQVCLSAPRRPDLSLTSHAAPRVHRNSMLLSRKWKATRPRQSHHSRWNRSSSSESTGGTNTMVEDYLLSAPAGIEDAIEVGPTFHSKIVWERRLSGADFYSIIRTISQKRHV